MGDINFTAALVLVALIAGVFSGLYANKWSPRDLNQKIEVCEHELPRNRECVLVAVPKAVKE